MNNETQTRELQATPEHPCQARHLPGAACVPTEAFCHRCARTTPTTLINLRSGLIANACKICRACRQGRPYIGRWDSQQPQLHDAGRTGQGANREQHNS